MVLALLWLLLRSMHALAQTPEPGAQPPPPQDEPAQPEPDVADDAPEQVEQPGDKPEPDDQDVNQGALRDPVLQQNEADPRTLEREPKAEDPSAEGPPQDKKDEETPMEICAQPPAGDVGVLQRVRRSLTVGACASSAWLDGLFGDQIYPDEYHATYGTVTAGALWSEYDGFDPRLRFRARLQLPQWDHRISAFAGRVGEEDYISDTEGDFDALPTRQFGTLEDESVLVGLGYSSPERTGNDFDAGVGVRIDLPMDPYARARYEIVRSFAEQYVCSACAKRCSGRTPKASARPRVSISIE